MGRCPTPRKGSRPLDPVWAKRSSGAHRRLCRLEWHEHGGFCPTHRFFWKGKRRKRRTTAFFGKESGKSGEQQLFLGRKAAKAENNSFFWKGKRQKRRTTAFFGKRDDDQNVQRLFLEKETAFFGKRDDDQNEQRLFLEKKTMIKTPRRRYTPRDGGGARRMLRGLRSLRILGWSG